MTPLLLASVFPVVSYHDAERGLSFLHALGFEDVWVARDDAGRVQHAELRWPSGVGTIMIGEADTDDLARTGTARTYLAAPPDSDLASLLEALVGVGAVVARPLSEGPGGGEVFSVFDPESNEWEVGHYPGGGVGAKR